MKDLKNVALGAFLAAAAAATAYAAPRCSNGRPAALSGDVFSPVECSTATASAVALPDLPPAAPKGVKTDLRDLDGRWAGDLIHGIGRYTLLLTVKAGRKKTELILEIKELQFRERLTDRLTLEPGKPRGAYEAVMTTTLAPDATLKGGAIVGARAEAKTPAERQVDLLFANGAAHRIYFSLKGKNELSLRAFSAVPGARLQTFETTFTRTTHETL